MLKKWKRVEMFCVENGNKDHIFKGIEALVLNYQTGATEIGKFYFTLAEASVV